MIDTSSEIPLHKLDSDVTGLPFPFGMSDYEDPCTREPQPHRHDFFEIHYITSGKGIHFIDFEDYEIEPYNLYFVSPNQIHFWNIKEKIDGRALVFTEEFLMLGSDKQNFVNALSFFHSVSSTPMLKLATTKKGRLAELLQQITYEYQHPQLAQASVLRAYLHIFLAEIQRHYEEFHPNQTINNFTQTRKFKRLLSLHFVNERAVEFYAEKMLMSTTSLHNIVKETTGLAPGQLIRNEVVLEAKRLLTHTNLSVAEVGYKLEFDDPAYFGRFFKREVGTTPAQFKKHSSEKYQFS